MNYDTVLIELLSRVQKLEAEVLELRKVTENNSFPQEKQSQTSLVRDYIIAQKQQAKNNGNLSLVLRAGDIEKAVGLKNRPVIVCNAMRQLMIEGDRVIEAPPSGASTTVKIEYFL